MLVGEWAGHVVFGKAVYRCMRLSVEYVNDAEGNVRAVQVPVGDWKRMLKALRGREQELKVKSDIAAALKEIEEMRKSKTRPQTMQEFLREL